MYIVDKTTRKSLFNLSTTHIDRLPPELLSLNFTSTFRRKTLADRTAWGATENVGLENAYHQQCRGGKRGTGNTGPSYRGGKRETSCYGTPRYKNSKKDKAFIARTKLRTVMVL